MALIRASSEAGVIKCVRVLARKAVCRDRGGDRAMNTQSTSFNNRQVLKIYKEAGIPTIWMEHAIEHLSFQSDSFS